MITGIVAGTLYSTINHPFYDGKKLLIVQRTDDTGQETGEYVIAADSVDAGVGQPVLVIGEGNSARQVFGDTLAPVRSVIVGIVDQVDTGSG